MKNFGKKRKQVGKKVSCPKLMNILLTNSGRRTYFINFLIELKKK